MAARQKIFIAGGVVLFAAFVLMYALGAREDIPEGVLVLRAAHLANVTHAAALVGRATDWFEKRLGRDVHVRWQVFNGGPTVVEGIFSGRIDVAYVGPGPAINGFVKSDGRALCVLAGATSGGAALVLRPGSGIREPKDLAGKRVAAPQLGNTQYLALRGYLKDEGLLPREHGGSVEVLPIANPDQLTLFHKGELDAAWTVEPWVSRLEQEAGGVVLFGEEARWQEQGGRYATALLIVRRGFMEEHPGLVDAWVQAHAGITDWIGSNRPEAIGLFNEQLEKLTGRGLPREVLESAFARLEFTTDPLLPSLRHYADIAFGLGFLGRKKPDLAGLVQWQN